MKKNFLGNKRLAILPTTAALLALTAFSGSVAAGSPAEAEPCDEKNHDEKPWVNSAAKNVKNGAMNKLAELAARKLAEK